MERTESMTGEDLRAWKKKMGYTYDRAAEALGVGRTTFHHYLKMEEVPRLVALACSALAAGLDEWGPG